MGTRWLIAAALLAHAAIHASFIAPRPPVTAGGPAWPFELGRSWLLAPIGLDARATRMVGMALIGLYFSPWLVVGVAIDALLLWAVLISDWAPEGVTP